MIILPRTTAIQVYTGVNAQGFIEVGNNSRQMSLGIVIVEFLGDCLRAFIKDT